MPSSDLPHWRATVRNATAQHRSPAASCLSSRYAASCCHQYNLTPCSAWAPQIELRAVRIGGVPMRRRHQPRPPPVDRHLPQIVQPRRRIPNRVRLVEPDRLLRHQQHPAGRHLAVRQIDRLATLARPARRHQPATPRPVPMPMPRTTAADDPPPTPCARTCGRKAGSPPISPPAVFLICRTVRRITTRHIDILPYQYPPYPDMASYSHRYSHIRIRNIGNGEFRTQTLPGRRPACTWTKKIGVTNSEFHI